jgi:hypothetical protein
MGWELAVAGNSEALVVSSSVYEPVLARVPYTPVVPEE